MTITFTLSDAHGTEVLAVRARLPPGLPDHRPTKSGGRSSLANLGALVEAGYRLAPGAHRCRCAKGCRRRMHDVHAVPSDSQMATKILGRSTAWRYSSAYAGAPQRTSGSGRLPRATG